MNRIRFVLVLLMIGMMLVACGASTTTNDQNSDSVAEEATVASTDSNGETDSENTSQDDTTATSDEWSGASFNQNLDTLSSYTAIFTYEQGDGDAKKVWSWQQRVIRDPLAVEIYTNDQGADSTAGTYHIVQIGDKMYSVTDDAGQCMLIVNQQDNQGLQPDSILSGLPFSMKKEGAGPDTFGQPTDKYTYAADDLDGSSYQATAIVDRANGFAYSYDVQGAQKNGDAKEPFHWTYELKDVNAVASIDIPKECENVGSGAKWPLPEGAELTMQTNEMISYNSTKSVNDLAEFYAKEMPAAGYTVAEGGMTTDTSVMANFSKDGITVTVIMTYQDGKTSVIITQQGS